MHFGGVMFFTDYSMSAPELARALEERGFESVWAPEHSHIPLSRKTAFPGGGDLPKQYYDAMDPFVVLAAAGEATRKIKLGTGVALIQQRDAIQTAKLVASIDQASQGRFLFGVGGGWNQDEMEDHGTVYATRFKRVRESIEAMKEIWTKEEAEYHGEFVNFDPMIARPKPVQKPHPLIHVGGAFPHGARRAIRYGDGWIPGGDTREVLRKFREMARDAGRDPASIEAAPGQPARPRPCLIAGSRSSASSSSTRAGIARVGRLHAASPDRTVPSSSYKCSGANATVMSGMAARSGAKRPASTSKIGQSAGVELRPEACLKPGLQRTLRWREPDSNRYPAAFLKRGIAITTSAILSLRTGRGSGAAASSTPSTFSRSRRNSLSRARIVGKSSAARMQAISPPSAGLDAG